MEKNAQNECENTLNYSSESVPQKVPLSEQYRIFIETVSGNLISNLNSWTFHYWLFFYGIIPFIILTIALLSKVLPSETFSVFFIQNQSNFLSISTYLNHFSHNEISHLVSNLLFYLISITIIFIFEDNKKRLKFCTVIFFTIVPILGSYLTLQMWNITHTVNGQNLGFSAIALAFFGYALYIAIKWIYATALLSIWLKSSETRIFTRIIGNFSVKQISRYELVQNFIFIIRFFLLAIIMGYIIKFSIDAGQYIVMNGTRLNGIGHFQGFILGLFSPIIFSILIEKTERIFDLVFLFLLFIGIWNYYSQYLAPLLQSN